VPVSTASIPAAAPHVNYPGHFSRDRNPAASQPVTLTALSR
jgi:hypothetical protein